MKKSLFALAALAAMGTSASAGWARKSADSFGSQFGPSLMDANIDSATLNQNNFMQAFGNAAQFDGSVALTANPVAADVIRVMRIPAGTKVSALMLANGDLDSNAGPTLVTSIGYAPVVPGDGPAASPAYFQAAGDTSLQAANAGKLYRNFAAITFEKDVYITMTIGTAAATFAAGTIHMTAIGDTRGIK